MNRLEQLIEELCPYGVKYKTIGEIANTNIGLATSVTKHKVTKGVLLLHNSDIQQNKIVIKKYEYITEEFAKKNEKKILHKGDIITVHTGDVGTSAVISDEYDGAIGFTTITARIKDKDLVLPEYLSSFLNSQLCKNQIASMTISDRNNLNQSSYEKILVPVPPLEVQAEIVRILDKFTELTTELATELANRKKQYEYYRNKILDEVIAKNEHLGDICTFIRGPFGGSLKKECFNTEGYAVYEQQHAIYSSLDIRYFINEQKYQELKRFEVKTNDLIISCSGTIGKVFIIPPNAPKGIINQALLKLSPSELVDSKYLKYCFENTLSTELNNSARGGAIQNVPSVAELKKITIKVPPINEQRHIVAILDRFDKLCNDISEGLPAEIDARKKQYEYYRDKLLTFKEAE